MNDEVKFTFNLTLKEIIALDVALEDCEILSALKELRNDIHGIVKNHKEHL